MDPASIEREWRILRGFLPMGWEELARTTGAFQRARGISDPDALLRVLLMHVGGGLSLRQAAVRAAASGIATISDVALLKRLRASEGWLRGMTQRMLAHSRIRPSLAPRWSGRRVRVVDATTVKEPGATGTSWRVHYSLLLPSLDCDFFEVTGSEGGESFRRLAVKPGDIVLGDRGYCHREGVAHIVAGGGDVLVRVTQNGFPLVSRKGAPFDVLEAARALAPQTPGEWAVSFDSSAGRLNARVCVLRKSEAAAERAKELARRKSRRMGKTTCARTLEAAEYVVILTTLTKREASTTDVLELYRARWQVELAFKRLKSLLSAGHVPKHDFASARAWLQGKLLVALLVERLLEEAGFFSPWGFPLQETKSLA